jgi:hypothetical protein
MNRRRFLAGLAIAPLAVKVAPLLPEAGPFSVVPPLLPATPLPVAWVEEYNTYFHFSTFVLTHDREFSKLMNPMFTIEPPRIS